VAEKLWSPRRELFWLKSRTMKKRRQSSFSSCHKKWWLWSVLGSLWISWQFIVIANWHRTWVEELFANYCGLVRCRWYLLILFLFRTYVPAASSKMACCRKRARANLAWFS
jgi:hypothetical protein